LFDTVGGGSREAGLGGGFPRKQANQSSVGSYPLNMRAAPLATRHLELRPISQIRVLRLTIPRRRK
jgi:hypothetical protein